MIKNKSDLNYYIKADKDALKIQKNSLKSIIKNFLIKDEINKFQVLLRKCEYYKNIKKNIFQWALFFFAYKKFKKKSIVLGFTIPLNVFGPGLSIAHYGTIVINSKTQIGANCRIHANVNIGTSANDDNAFPQIGSNVYIGPGAKIFGKITIADNTVIGANAVVNKSFGEGNIVIAGVPARKIRDIDKNEISKLIRMNNTTL